MRLSDFDFYLPRELIAQRPAATRSASRLLHLDGKTGAMHDLQFQDLPQLVRPGDLLVFNDTRVIKARLRGRKRSGGQVEVLVERVLGEHEALAQVRASKPPREGSELVLAGEIPATVLAREGTFFRLRFHDEADLFTLLERHGEVPLPPYIEHAPGAEDERRYQTVYARTPGAVAAPTAGLHFDEAMLERLRQAGAETAFLTLHVGAGTFQPVREEDLSRHVMHHEWYRIPEETVAAVERARARGGRVLAVGTTTLRALEAAATRGSLRPGADETNLFILPGYRFRVVERLLTNFHLPKSTLLMLVSAFGGIEPIRRAYAHAVEQRYRFFSYGDAMLIERQQD
ncbi:tRNA preQ1(34) S-adenosylmethionine ribosyltransferase-isomerase QueA [Pelomicrobium sp.]|jgi:S-adenosylmethionine:tRNA ribosyltransferase-isomerase|uniref:tRNA preQ1(34) S-adenosylmethionine ribosyltransferase-isomerase QueA n=1 Tax=Pelomicrobium sp. TaxID=2815319 RepID=UPI002FDCCC43